jgi:hypothetical protein
MDRFGRTGVYLLAKYNGECVKQISVVSHADNRTAKFSHTGDIKSAFSDSAFERCFREYTFRCNRLHSYIEPGLVGPVLYLDFFKSDDLFEW